MAQRPCAPVEEVQAARAPARQGAQPTASARSGGAQAPAQGLPNPGTGRLDLLLLLVMLAASSLLVASPAAAVTAAPSFAFTTLALATAATIGGRGGG